MPTMAPEREDVTSLLPDFEIPCDGPRVWPEAIKPHDTPAKWVALKKCGHHRLLCEDCKELYLQQITKADIGWICAQCEGPKGSSGIIGFELLRKSS